MGSGQPITYPFGRRTKAGTVQQVVPGLWWICLPMTFPPSHINVWLLEDGDGFDIVDTGLDNEETKAVWQKVFNEVIKDRPVRRVIVTHHHRDHISLARWLSEKTGAGVYMTQGEWALTQALHTKQDGEFADFVRGFCIRHGLDLEWGNYLASRGNTYRAGVPELPEVVETLVDGEIISMGGRDWRVVTCGGHTLSHGCLYSKTDNLLISGDQVMPGIQGNVSVPRFSQDRDVVTDYLASLDRLAEFDDGGYVMPSHGAVFTGLHRRLMQLRHYHQSRSEAVTEACARKNNLATDLLPLFSGKTLRADAAVFTVGEVLGHLNHLQIKGSLEQIQCDDGRVLYARTSRNIGEMS